jgi:uncharacterized RDD family membrane protein YckC
MKIEEGIYFRRDDYAAFWLRLVIDVVDIMVVGAICSALIIALLAIFPTSAMIGDLILATCLAIAFCYFVVLKRSKAGTAGYRVGGVRIVGLDGQTASWSSLTFRLVFAAFGPLNYIMDFIWLSGHPHRQALRDKFARTYVVKRKAEPAGTGKVVFRYYEILGCNFLFREVEVPAEQ